MKILLQPLTMDWGIPCNLAISATNLVATIDTVKLASKAKKCPYIERLSTTTIMTGFSLTIGKPVIKSKDMSSHTWFGMGKGNSNPPGLKLVDLAC